MDVPPELLQALASMMASAIQSSVTQATTNVGPAGGPGATAQSAKPPSFTVSEYRSSEGSSVEDYFKRFTWALQLSKIPEEQHANFARVYIGGELNNALKFLISPRLPEDLTYDELQTTLINHFDRVKNKYVESVKFRHITQQKGETIAAFALRLRQGSAYCEYGEFLDRMLIEQFLHGLSSRETCDEIIGKKPATFGDAYEIAHTLEATRVTSNEVKTNGSGTMTEAVHKLGYASPQYKQQKREVRSKHQTHERGEQKNSRVRQLGEQRSGNKSKLRCEGCGEPHMRDKCRFREVVCHKCQKKGHIAKVCKSGNLKRIQAPVGTMNRAVNDAQPASQIDVVHRLDRLLKINGLDSSSKLMLTVQIEGHSIEMELDTGAPYGIVSRKTLQAVKPNYRLLKTDRRFASYTGHRVNCIGRVMVEVTMGLTSKILNLYVVDGDFDSLFGREWISHFVREIKFCKLFNTAADIHSITATTPVLEEKQKIYLDQFLSNFTDVFSSIPGKLAGPPVSVHFKPGTSPIFSRAREVPLALRDAYAKEINAKIESGFYERVEHSEWASTTHIVMKKNGKLRITGNYKPTLNPRIIIDEYPIPKVEHLFNRMKGAKLFCHLDVTDAYTHLPVDAEFSHALTLNTPTHGLIRPTRAVYGAANIPAVWQRRVETILQDVPNVLNFFDDILVFADNFDNLISSLDTVFQRLRLNGLKLNRDKCIFATSTVEFLGHKIDAQGIYKSDKHIRTIRNTPKPTTPEELQLFLGKATYYGAFIPDLSSRSRALRDVLQVKPWQWTTEAEAAYEDIKNALISPQVLMPYDPQLPLVLATDASKTGLGAVLSHRLNNETERPIAYASRMMTATEQRYPQIDKEALAIVWAVQKFFHYVYARHFILITDHKPLTQILHPEKSLPVLCISRMANYADYLSHFNFDIVFKPTKANANADYCSRMPLSSTEDTTHANSEREEEEEVTQCDGFDHFIMNQIKQLPVRVEHIANKSHEDPHCKKMIQILEKGQSLADFGYKAPEANYTLSRGCLLLEHRVVIPSSLRPAILADLHAAHIGIVKMKGLARSFVFWPGIDADIEAAAKTCMECGKHAHAPPKYREHHWEYPKKPWERIHIDYAGPVEGRMLLVIVDAFSKWLEVKVTSSTTSTATIDILDELFASHGIPVTVVSDNGTQFTSAEFKEFLQVSGVKYHKRTAPYHPATNGQAERYVQTVKDALKAMATTKDTLQRNLNEFLRQYRRAPHTTTGQPPSQLFLGRSLRTRLDLVRPQEKRIAKAVNAPNQAAPPYRTFEPSQGVYFISGNPRMDRWIPGVVVNRMGDLHYEIEYKGRRFKRHVDQVRSRQEESRTNRQPQPISPTDPNREIARPRYIRYHSKSGESTRCQPTVAPVPPPVNIQVQARPPATESTPTLRRSQRQRRPPDRFTPT